MSTIAPPETRTITAKVRWDPATRSKGERRISGYASVFNSESEDLGFRETIAPGAFKRSLSKPGADFWLLWGHDHLEPLARTSAGTLELAEDHKGLKVSAELVDTTTGRDVHALVKAGLVRSMSFGFYVKADQWETRNGVDHRLVTEAELIEVSVVPVPAYESTEVSVRASQALVERVARVTGTKPIRVRDRSVYGPDSKFSWYRDFVAVEEARQAKEARFGTTAYEYPGKSTMDDNLHGTLEDAQRRLDTVKRDIGTTAMDPFVPVTAGGAFVGSLFATSARARAVIASTLTQGDLPKGGMTVTVPRLTTSSTAAAHVELAAVSETDPGTSQQTGTVQIIAGQVDLAQQLFDSSPGGAIDQAISQSLGEAVGAALDTSVLAALLAAIAGGTTVTYTDATPTVAETWGQIVNLRQQVHTALGVEPDLLLLHPRRLAYIDQTLTNPLPFRERIISTPSISVTAGAGAEDRVWILASHAISLLSRAPELKVMFEVPSSTLTVRIQAYQATALVIRQPKAVGLLTGSGLTTPSYPVA